jgi:hypothetical protein
VAPGADPRAIRLEIAGADAVSLDGGDVVIEAAGETLRLHEPVVYQNTAAGRARIDGRFRLQGRRIAFDVGQYDRARPLVIDPVVTYSSYLPSAASGVGTDSAGNIYVSGGGLGIIKLSADGSTLLYSTVLGDMSPGPLVVDLAGNAYFQATCPFPRSGVIFACPTVGPLTSGRPQAQGDVGAYVGKLGPTGDLQFLTSMGGTGSVELGGIAIDPSGNIYATASNALGGFPLTREAFFTPAGFRGFHTVVEAIAADLTTFLYVVEFQTGGDVFRPRGIAADRFGAAYVTGTAGAAFPTTPGAFQPAPGGTRSGVLAKIAADSSLAYATYFGNDTTAPEAVTVDAIANAYIAGRAGAGLPTANALQPALAGGAGDAFVARFDALGSTLVFSTFLGGSGDDGATAVDLDAAGNVYIAGTTRSTDFPQSNPLPAGFATAASNFVTELSSDGRSLVFSTYFADAQTAITAMDVTAAGTIFLAGATSSPALPTVRPFQATPGGGFVAKIEPSQGTPTPSPSAIDVFITSPTEGATVSGSTVWVDIWAANFVGSSNTFTLSINGTVLATGTASNHATIAFDSRSVPDGPQTLTATVRDSAGNVGSATRNLIVSNGTTPTLAAAFTSPAAGATVSGTANVAMSAIGATGTPVTFSLTVDGTQVFTSAGSATTTTFALNTLPLAAGAHTLGLSVRDGVGRTASATQTINVANGSGGGATPPPGGGTLGVFITSPAEGATVSGVVWSDIWVEGAAAGTRTFTLSIGGVTLATTTDASNHVTLPWDSTRVANGTQTLTATVRDAAGNTGTVTRTFTVQNAGGGGATPAPAPTPEPTPPPPAGPIGVFITQPTNGATVSGVVWFTVWISGATPGAKTFTLTEGGRTLATTTDASNGPVSLVWATTAADNGSRNPTVGVRDSTGATGSGAINVNVAN